MRSNKYEYIGVLLLVTIFSLFTHSCNKTDDEIVEFRLFQPVLNQELFSINNSIIVNLGKMKRAQGYLIEVSRDSFETVEYSFQVDTNYFVIDKTLTSEDLLWFTVYQVQATSLADNSEYNSYPSFLGSVRTQKYPSNMGVPTMFDVLDTRARVFWYPTGDAITKVKVFAHDDERLNNPLKEFEVSPNDKSEKIITDLEPNTTYQIAIYSGDNIRGWEIYTTREPLISGENVIDLTGISEEINLSEVLQDAPDGGLILLEGGKTYQAGGYEFDKNLTFQSGYSFTPALPIIDCTSNFNIKEGSNSTTIHFKQIEFTAPNGFESKYIFNIDRNASVAEIKFESCNIHNLVGITRAKEGTGTLDKFTIIDCVIDSISSVGILSIDVNTWICNDITIQNSTFSRCARFIASRGKINSILVDAVTANEVPMRGSILFYGLGGATVNSIQVNNSVWGHGWDTTGGDNYALLGVFYQITAEYMNATNTYVTSDFSLQYAALGIPGMPGPRYSGSASELWVDPNNGNFNFKDSSFTGKSDCGDPRWRM